MTEDARALSDEQISRIRKDVGDMPGWTFRFARAIESAVLSQPAPQDPRMVTDVLNDVRELLKYDDSRQELVKLVTTIPTRNAQGEGKPFGKDQRQLSGETIGIPSASAKSGSEVADAIPREIHERLVKDAKQEALREAAAWFNSKWIGPPPIQADIALWLNRMASEHERTS